jgi:hypothetical protein
LILSEQNLATSGSVATWRCRAVSTRLRFHEEHQAKGIVMRIGLSMPLPAYTIDPAFMGRTAERLGFDSIWYAEHPAVPVDSASPFPATGGAIPIAEAASSLASAQGG